MFEEVFACFQGSNHGLNLYHMLMVWGLVALGGGLVLNIILIVLQTKLLRLKKLQRGQ